MPETSSTVLTPVEISQPYGVKAKCSVDSFGLKQGAYEETDSFGLSETGTYVNNLKHGPFQVKENGHLKCEGMYFFGKYQGLLYRYAPNGQMIEKSIYINGELRGMSRKWDEHGSLTKLGRYDKEGYFTGVRISYHDNHHPKNISYYKRDDLHGLDAWYDKRGVLVQLERHKQGSSRPLTEEDRDILKLAQMFVDYRANPAPAYAITNAAQYFAVEAFRHKYPESAFLEVFPKKEEVESRQEAAAYQKAAKARKAEEERRQRAAELKKFLESTQLYQPKVVGHQKKEQPKPSITIADSFFRWMPAFAHVHD